MTAGELAKLTIGNLSKFSEQELRDLNSRVVQELNIRSRLYLVRCIPRSPRSAVGATRFHPQGSVGTKRAAISTSRARGGCAVARSRALSALLA